MNVLGNILWWTTTLYMVVVISRVVMDWIPLDYGAARKITLFLHNVTDPLLSPLRRIIPLVPMSGGLALDFSPFVLLVILAVIQYLIQKFF